MGWLLGNLVIGLVIVVVILVLAWLTSDSKWVQDAISKKARRDAQVICPHCRIRGRVTTEPVKLKKGISGAKATGAILTGGLSILATGLSRKENATEARCSNCGSVWHF